MFHIPIARFQSDTSYSHEPQAGDGVNSPQMTYVSAAKAYMYHPLSSLELVAVMPKRNQNKKSVSRQGVGRRDRKGQQHSPRVSSPAYRTDVCTLLVLLLLGDMVSV